MPSVSKWLCDERFMELLMTKAEGLTQLFHKKENCYIPPSWPKTWDQGFRQVSNRSSGQRWKGKQLHRCLPFSLPPRVEKSETAAQHQKPWALAAAESRGDQRSMCGSLLCSGGTHGRPPPPAQPGVPGPHTALNLPSPQAARPPSRAHHRSPLSKGRAGRPASCRIRYRSSGPIRANNFSREVEEGGGSGARWWRRRRAASLRSRPEAGGAAWAQVPHCRLSGPWGRGERQDRARAGLRLWLLAGALESGFRDCYPQKVCKPGSSTLLRVRRVRRPCGGSQVFLPLAVRHIFLVYVSHITFQYLFWKVSSNSIYPHLDYF